jgi:chromate reductase, NAD(P)H dehydrogenase (quinone)
MIMARLKIAVVVGSNRRDSINRRLAEALVKLRAADFDVTWVRIDDLPMYNVDLPPAASVARFKAEIAAADGVLVVTPEHNRSIPAVLKNAVDWGSKPADTNVWRDKPTAITGTSPGAIGTAVAQQHLRQVLGVLGALVMGGEAYITYKSDLVAADGSITVPATRTFLQDYIDRFAALTTRLATKTVPARRETIVA